MTDLAALGLSVRSDGLVVATDRLKDFEKASGRAADGATGIERRSTVLSASLRRLSAVAAGAAGALAAAFGARAVISGIAEFDSSMSRVAAISRATVGDMIALRETAVEMGATTEFSAAQAADGLAFLGMAGFSAAESVAALPPVLDLATAAGMGLAEAADTASNIMSAFGIAAQDAAGVTDILAAASTRANTNVAQLGQAISTAGPIASTLNIALADTAAAIGVMSDAGIQGERAGTALRGVLASLAGPTTQAQEALANYGLTVADVDPATRSLADIMDTLARSGLSTADAMTIFGREAASGALVMIQSSERLREFGQELRDVDGAASDMAGTMRDNLRGDIQGLGSAVSTLIIAMGDAGLTGVLRAVVRAITGFVRGVALITSQLGDAIGAVNRFFSAQARIEQQIDNTRMAISDEQRALGALTDAMGPGMSMSAEMAQAKLSEAMARRTNIQAIIDEQRALGMASSEYRNLSSEIEYLQIQSAALRNTGRDGGPFAPSANRADIEFQTREILRLAAERQRLLDPGGQSTATLRANEAAINRLQDAISNASGGMVTFSGAVATVLDGTERLTINMDELPAAAGGASRAVDDLTEAQRRALAVIGQMNEGAVTQYDVIAALEELYRSGAISADQLSRAIDSVREETERANRAQNEWARSMAGHFDGLITGGKDLSGVLMSIARQLESRGWEMLFSGLGGGGGGGGLFGLIGSLFGFGGGAKIRSFEGGGYTGDGPRSGGLDGRGGRLAMVHPDETVIDHRRSGGGTARSEVLVRLAVPEGVTVQEATQIAGNVAVRVVSAGLGQNRRALPNQIGTLQSRGV